MKTNDFDIGDAVYTLHTDDNQRSVYLKYGLVVGIDTSIKINFHGAHLSTDLAENIRDFIYSVMPIYTNDDGTFSLSDDDCPEMVYSAYVFENRDDAQIYLHTMADNIQLRT